MLELNECSMIRVREMNDLVLTAGKNLDYSIKTLFIRHHISSGTFNVCNL